VEDLNVAGMVRNRKLARHIADAGFGETRRQLAYKTRWNGGRIVVADRWYPSSKTCSACKTVKAKLSLRERMFHCEHCGLVIDRDVNAARNLLHLATDRGRWSVPGEAGPDPSTRGPNARRADRKTTPGVAGGIETCTAMSGPAPHRGASLTITQIPVNGDPQRVHPYRPAHPAV
jgi:putative transposase